jgi:hypothetical protein
MVIYLVFVPLCCAFAGTKDRSLPFFEVFFLDNCFAAGATRLNFGYSLYACFF